MEVESRMSRRVQPSLGQCDRGKGVYIKKPGQSIYLDGGEEKSIKRSFSHPLEESACAEPARPLAGLAAASHSNNFSTDFPPSFPPLYITFPLFPPFQN